MIIKCPACGASVSDKAKNCPKCGHPLTDVSNKQQSNNSAKGTGQETLSHGSNDSQNWSIEPEKGKWNIGKLALVSVIALALIGALVYFIIPKKDKTSVPGQNPASEETVVDKEKMAREAYEKVAHLSFTMEGSIDEKYRTHFDLSRNNDEITGTYYYLSSGPDNYMTIKGTIDVDKLDMSEFYNGNSTGRFVGRIYQGDVFVGEFISTKGTRMPCRFKIDKSIVAGGANLREPRIVSQSYDEPYGKGSISIEAPDTGNETADNVIIQYFSHDLNYTGSATDLEQMIQYMLNSWKGSQREMSSGSGPKYENSYRAEKTYENSKVVSYETSYYTYMGGLHGMTASDGMTFVKASGDVIDWAIFKPWSTDGFSELMLKYVKKEFDSISEGELNHDENGDLPKPSGLYFSDNGITFTYVDYELGPHSLGSPEITIPYNEVKEYMQNSGLELIPNI